MADSLNPQAFPSSLQARIVALHGESRSIVEDKNGSRLQRFAANAIFLAPESMSTADRLRWLHHALADGGFEAAFREAIQESGLPNGARNVFSFQKPTHKHDLCYFSLRGDTEIQRERTLDVPLWTAELGHWGHDPEKLPQVFQSALASFFAYAPEREPIPFLGPLDIAALCAGVESAHPDKDARGKPSLAAASVALAESGANAGAVSGMFAAYEFIRDAMEIQPRQRSEFAARLASELEARDLRATSSPMERSGSQSAAPRAVFRL